MKIKHIEIDEDVKQGFMLFKIQTKAKNVRDVLKLALEKLKEAGGKNGKS